MDEQPNEWDQYNAKSGEKCEESLGKFTRLKRLWLAQQCSNMKEPKKKIELDAKAPEFRPKRKTADKAKNRLNEISIYEDDEL